MRIPKLPSDQERPPSDGDGCLRRSSDELEIEECRELPELPVQKPGDHGGVDRPSVERSRLLEVAFSLCEVGQGREHLWLDVRVPDGCIERPHLGDETATLVRIPSGRRVHDVAGQELDCVVIVAELAEERECLQAALLAELRLARKDQDGAARPQNPRPQLRRQRPLGCQQRLRPPQPLGWSRRDEQRLEPHVELGGEHDVDLERPLERPRTSSNSARTRSN